MLLSDACPQCRPSAMFLWFSPPDALECAGFDAHSSGPSRVLRTLCACRCIPFPRRNSSDLSHSYAQCTSHPSANQMADGLLGIGQCPQSAQPLGVSLSPHHPRTRLASPVWQQSLRHGTPSGLAFWDGWLSQESFRELNTHWFMYVLPKTQLSCEGRIPVPYAMLQQPSILYGIPADTLEHQVNSSCDNGTASSTSSCNPAETYRRMVSFKR